MKRYLLFKFATYYASGGWCDFVNDFETLEAAQAERIKLHDAYGSTQIVDTLTKQIIISQYESFPAEAR